MKSKAEKSHNDNQGNTAKAIALQKSTGKKSLEMADNREVSASQTEMQMMIDQSPRLTVQRRQLERSFDTPVQRQGPEEEEALMQGKFTAQRAEIEDEELLQGTFETVQRQAPEEEELLQGTFETVQRRGPEEEEELMQGKFKSRPINIVQTKSDMSENKTGMPDHLKAGLENLSGISMDDVKVHYNSSKPAEINAHAFTQGKDIHIASGEEKHLPHEGWHVVQQKQGRVNPTMQIHGDPVNDDSVLEKEADVMGGEAGVVPVAQSIRAPAQREPRDKATVANLESIVKSDSRLSDSGLPMVAGSSNRVQEDIVQRIGAIELRKRQIEAKGKHGLMVKISEGIQRFYSKLKFVEGIKSEAQRAIKINMALAGKVEDEDPAKTLKILVPDADDVGMKLVLTELSSLPEVDADTIEEAAIRAFAHYTKEGYENVTGIARGRIKYSKTLGEDIGMKKGDIEKGKQTLKLLIKNWSKMPKFTGDKVYRVVHAGTGEDGLSDGASMEKKNPTSTSVSLDWSRVEKGKTCCLINIKAVEIKPVDTRAVSTYTHEGEILLPPGTKFTKVGKKGDYTEFNAEMPGNVGAMKTDLIE